MSANIEQLRTRIATLQAERTALHDGPASSSEQHSSVAAWCAAQAALAAPMFRHHVAGGGSLDELFALRVPSGGSANIGMHMAGLLGAKHLAELLCRHLDGSRDGPTGADRAQRLAQLDAEILALEIEEEALIDASEATGAAIARRSDADPRAVLGVVEPRSLPAADDDDDVPVTLPVVPSAPMPKPARIARSDYVARSRNSEGTAS